MIRLVLLIAGIITVVRPAQAASVLMEQAMELPGFAMWADSGSPGLLLAVVNGKDSAVMGFGTGTAERGSSRASQPRAGWPDADPARINHQGLHR